MRPRREPGDLQTEREVPFAAVAAQRNVVLRRTLPGTEGLPRRAASGVSVRRKRNRGSTERNVTGASDAFAEAPSSGGRMQIMGKLNRTRDRSRRDPAYVHAGPRSVYLHYRHNGRNCFRDDPDLLGPQPPQSCLQVFGATYRYHSAVFARYCAEQRLTPKQLRTVEALYIDGLSQNMFAGIERTTAEAIRQRILGMAIKAPEFYRWWRGLNQSRRRGSRSRRGTL